MVKRGSHICWDLRWHYRTEHSGGTNICNRSFWQQRIERTVEQMKIDLSFMPFMPFMVAFRKYSNTMIRVTASIPQTHPFQISNFDPTSLRSAWCSVERETIVDSSREFSFSRFIGGVTAFGNDLSKCRRAFSLPLLAPTFHGFVARQCSTCPRGKKSDFKRPRHPVSIAAAWSSISAHFLVAHGSPIIVRRRTAPRGASRKGLIRTGASFKQYRLVE